MAEEVKLRSRGEIVGSSLYDISYLSSTNWQRTSWRRRIEPRLPRRAESRPSADN